MDPDPVELDPDPVKMDPDPVKMDSDPVNINPDPVQNVLIWSTVRNPRPMSLHNTVPLYVQYSTYCRKSLPVV